MIDAPSPWHTPNASLTRRQCLQMAAAWGLMGSALQVLAQSPKPRMRVGFIARYRPYSFAQADGSLNGFDVDVVAALMQALDMEMAAQSDSLDRLRQKLQNKEIDFIGNQLLMTPENRRSFDFAKPYATIQLVSVLHENDERDFLSLDDFLGKKLGVLASTGVLEQTRGVLGKAVQGFERIEDALRALAERQLDAVLEENLIAEHFIERDGLPLKVGAPFAAPMPAGLALPKGAKDLELRLSEAVQILVKTPHFKRISSHWFGYDVSRPRVSHASSN
jgi:cystine transport system substrate-binding protein